jgi:Uma2 family endonuclease
MPVLEQAKDIVGAMENGRRRWTVDESCKLAELFPGERYELIEGDVISKMGQKPLHAYVIMVLTRMLAAAFPGKVRIQSSICLPEPEGKYSEPEPDVVLVNKPEAEFARRHPGPEDIALLIEVTDTSFQMDREIKYRLYARAGIAEYWIIDIAKRRTFVCREPSGDEYKSITIRDAHEEVTTLSTPAFAFSLKNVLPE